MTLEDTEPARKPLDPEQWVESYSDALYSYALYRINDAEIARDLVQETFVAALKARQNFSGNSKEKTWLTGILKNKIVDYLRVKYKSINYSFDTLNERTEIPFFDDRGEWLIKPGRWQDNPECVVELAEFMSALHKCLAVMPENQRNSFIMKEIDEFETKEICKVLDISSTNYWVLMHRARLAIRDCLERNVFSTDAANR